MPNLKCHHIGIATSNLEKEIDYYTQLQYVQEGEIFEDPLQKIRGVFMVNNGIRIELLEGTSEESPTINFLKKGIQMYHQGYFVNQLEEQIEQFVQEGAILVSPPKPAIAFNGRRIAFLLLRNRMLIEFIEKDETD